MGGVIAEWTPRSARGRKEGRLERRNRRLLYQVEEMKGGSSGQREGQREIELDKITTNR